MPFNPIWHQGSGISVTSSYPEDVTPLAPKHGSKPTTPRAVAAQRRAGARTHSSDPATPENAGKQDGRARPSKSSPPDSVIARAQGLQRPQAQGGQASARTAPLAAGSRGSNRGSKTARPVASAPVCAPVPQASACRRAQMAGLSDPGAEGPAGQLDACESPPRCVPKRPRTGLEQRGQDLIKTNTGTLQPGGLRKDGSGFGESRGEILAELGLKHEAAAPPTAARQLETAHDNHQRASCGIDVAMFSPCQVDRLACSVELKMKC